MELRLGQAQPEFVFFFNIFHIHNEIAGTLPKGQLKKVIAMMMKKLMQELSFRSVLTTQQLSCTKILST